MKRIVIAVAVVVGLSVSVTACGGDKCGELSKQICASGLDCTKVDAWLGEEMKKTPSDQHSKACEMILASPASLDAYKKQATMKLGVK